MTARPSSAQRTNNKEHGGGVRSLPSIAGDDAAARYGTGRAVTQSLAPKVDEGYAREVAARFVAARNTPRSPEVRAAYMALQEQSDTAFRLMTGGGAKSPIRVMFTHCATPYASDDEMISAVRATRLLEVTTCAIGRDRHHPLLGNARGGAYDRFRAVHDIVGHVWSGLRFDRDGELGAWLTQDRLYTGVARVALGTELHGEHSVCWTTGRVAEHKATLLDRSVLARARRGACFRLLTEEGEASPERPLEKRGT